MSSKTTQKTELPEASPEEKAMMSMMTESLMPSYLSEQGYDVSVNKQKYEDTQESRNFSEQRSRLNQQRASIENQLRSLDNSQNQGRQELNRTPNYDRERLNMQLADINRQLTAVDTQENDFTKSWKPEVSYDVRKMGSPRVEAARAAAVASRGNLPEEELRKQSLTYSAAIKAEEREKIKEYNKQRELVQKYQEKTLKYLNGDFSITEAQKNQIATNMAPMRTALESMFQEANAAADRSASDSRSEVGRSDARMRGEVATTTGSLLDSMNRTFTEFESRVQETGMSISDALDATGQQIMQTGMDMEGALKNTVSVHKELLKLGIEDTTGKVTKQIAARAAAMGRSPDDPEYTAQIAETVAKQVKDGTLNLAAMEAQGMLSIKERTGAGLEDVAKGKVGVAERTGGLMEQSALQRGATESGILERQGAANEAIASRISQAMELITGQQGATREELVRAKGAGNMALEEQAANARWQVGGGMTPQQVGLAQGVSQYNQAVAQQRIANAGAAAGAASPYVGYMQNERMAEPTTTVTQNMGFGGIMSGILGAAGAGASIYGGITSANAMRDMARRYV